MNTFTLPSLEKESLLSHTYHYTKNLKDQPLNLSSIALLTYPSDGSSLCKEFDWPANIDRKTI